jgi:hypothetical protein
MAINRTLQFYGVAYGDTPVTLDVKVNGQQVFLNTVSTIAGDLPGNIYDIVCDQILFELDNTDLFPITFSGSYDHSIEVSGGSGIVLQSVLSNYMTNHSDVTGNLWNVYGNASSFLSAYEIDSTNSEGTSDVRSGVKIDGVAQGVVSSGGTWTQLVHTGSNLSCNLNIDLGSWAEYHPQLGHGHDYDHDI